MRRLKNSAPLRLYAKYFSTPRALNDYATHVPILIGLARLREIKSVLEFGCGYYSTLTFLNRAAYPHLERLQSVENDASWAETIHEAAKSDERWTLNLVRREIADSVPDLEAFDLILIDDSKTSAQRSATIRAVAAKQPQRAWIAIHDFEVGEYRRAAADFKQRHIFRAFNPETGVVSNSPTHLKSLDRAIKAKARTIEADQTGRWIRTLSALSAVK
ncbi:MAG TPA: class I SAM-dependent methyltransferase [Pyrinomonadaceae bacterium]